jgi:hypothetical protein
MEHELNEKLDSITHIKETLTASGKAKDLRGIRSAQLREMQNAVN